MTEADLDARAHGADPLLRSSAQFTNAPRTLQGLTSRCLSKGRRGCGMRDDESREWSLFGGQDPCAIEWAIEHAAECLTKDGPGRPLADTTRVMIHHTIVRALKNGVTNQQLAHELTRVYGYSPERAEMIARFEIRMAQGHGHLIGAMRVGQTHKRWLLANTDTPCPLCQANADQGFIPIGKNFVSGVQAPLMHVGCRCCITFRRVP